MQLQHTLMICFSIKFNFDHYFYPHQYEYVWLCIIKDEQSISQRAMNNSSSISSSSLHPHPIDQNLELDLSSIPLVDDYRQEYIQQPVNQNIHLQQIKDDLYYFDIYIPDFDQYRTSVQNKNNCMLLEQKIQATKREINETTKLTDSLKLQLQARDSTSNYIKYVDTKIRRDVVSQVHKEGKLHGLAADKIKDQKVFIERGNEFLNKKQKELQQQIEKLQQSKDNLQSTQKRTDERISHLRKQIREARYLKMQQLARDKIRAEENLITRLQAKIGKMNLQFM